MANTKISALTSSTTPLAGTEVLPIVQSSATVKVAVSDLTAGRSVSMSAATISSGNLTFSSTAQRITGDFNNGTIANRVAFQTSTANSVTVLTVIPNGSSSSSALSLEGDSTVVNGTTLQFTNNVASAGTESRITAGIRGAGAYLPITTYVGGFENTRQPTSGGLTISAAAGLGYGTGSGGTVTQATSKSTGVTLNKPTGQITMNNAALLPATSVIFLLSNSLLAAADSIIVQPNYGANSQGYTAEVTFVGAGGAYIRVTNISVGSLSEAVTLSFAIIKGATA